MIQTNKNNNLTGINIFTAFMVAFGLFALYNANLRHGSGVDSIPATLIPASIINEQNFNLDEFEPLLNNEKGTLKAAYIFGVIQTQHGELVSSYPIGAAILATPFYYAAQKAGKLKTWHHYRLIAKIAASSMTAISAAFLFLSLLNFTSYKPALLLTIFYGAGTCLWPTISQDLWQHGPGILCLSAALFLICHLRYNESKLIGALIGALLGMAVISRLLNIIPAVILSLYVLKQHRSIMVSLAIPAALLAAWLTYFNITIYNSITGGYEAIYTSQWHGWRKLTTTGAYTTPIFYGLGGILISPSKGLLIYSPYLIFSFAALIVVLSKDTTQRSLALALSIWIIFSTALLAKNSLWWGGTAFGSRYLSEALLPLTILIAIAWPRLFKMKVVLACFICLGVISILIQSIGAFYYPCGWAKDPVSADHQPHRHWDWQDSEIKRCINQGLDQGPKAFNLIRHNPNQDF
jgi:hypothetical protein